MTRGIPIVVAAFLAVTAGTAAAQTGRGFFATANVGSSESSLHPAPVARIDDREESFDVGIGYAFNRHVAIEAARHEFGEVTGFVVCPPDGCFLDEADGCPGAVCAVFVRPVPVDVDISGWSARVSGSLPLTGRFAAFGSVGVIAWDTSASEIVTLPGIGAVDDSGEDLILGAGLRWHVSRHWILQVSYEHAELDIGSSKLGAAFRF